MKFPFHRFSDEITADDNDVKFKQWNGRERSLYFEPRYDFGDIRYHMSNGEMLGGITWLPARESRNFYS